jgi:hypothetical protein
LLKILLTGSVVGSSHDQIEKQTITRKRSLPRIPKFINCSNDVLLSLKV